MVVSKKNQRVPINPVGFEPQKTLDRLAQLVTGLPCLAGPTLRVSLLFVMTWNAKWLGFLGFWVYKP